MKYCPLCDAEYAASHEQCSVCGVDLVPEELRGHPLDEQQRNEKIVVIWRGGDPLAVSEVISALRDAGIRHHVQPTNEHMVFELGMPRPKYAVRVFSSDAAKAKEMLSDIRESPPFALDQPDDLEDETRKWAPHPPRTARHPRHPHHCPGPAKTAPSPNSSKPACAKTASESAAKAPSQPACVS